MTYLVNLIFSMLALIVTAYLVPGFTIISLFDVFVTAIVLGIINVLIKPIMLLITLPLNVLTLGLFTFVINGLMLILASAIVPGFLITGWIPAIIGGIVLALVQAVLFVMRGKDAK